MHWLHNGWLEDRARSWMLLPCLPMHINLQHVFKMSAFALSHEVNGCDNCALYNAAPNIQQMAFFFETESLSLRFNSHFPGGPGLVGTRVSPFWILSELRVTEVVVTTGAIRRAKFQSKCHQSPPTNQ